MEQTSWNQLEILNPDDGTIDMSADALEPNGCVGERPIET